MAAAQVGRLLGVLPPQLQGARGQLSATPTASVVIVNRDGRKYLEACLESLLAEDLEGGLQVLLVDNGSSDGSIGFVEQHFPEVRVIALGANQGFAGGNNRGLAAASGRHVVLLNNDTRVRRGFLGALVGALESDAAVGAAQAKLVFADRPDVVQNAGLVLLSDGSGGDRGAGDAADRYTEREEVFGACAAAVAYRREMLADAGRFDPTFFAYYEDLDLAWRMRLRGWKALLEPAAVVEHVHAGTSAPDSPLMRFHADRNRLFTVLKNAPTRFVLASFGSLGARATGADAAAPGRLPGHRGRVARSFALHLPEMLVKRAAIRVRRSVPDDQVLRWLYPRDEWDRRRSGSG